MHMRSVRLVVLALVIAVQSVSAQNSGNLTSGAKVFVNQMPDGFDTFLKAAFAKKGVPLTVVPTKDDAEFEITGTSETVKAGKAKKIIRLDWHSDEQATIAVSNVKSGEVVFAYSVNKKSSRRGKQSTAEACAKHLKKKVTQSGS
jgi:hypothetical protein